MSTLIATSKSLSSLIFESPTNRKQSVFFIWTLNNTNVDNSREVRARRSILDNFTSFEIVIKKIKTEVVAIFMIFLKIEGRKWQRKKYVSMCSSI